MKTVEQYAAIAAGLPDEELLNELQSEADCEQRCCGSAESQDCGNAIEAYRAEILKRMRR